MKLYILTVFAAILCGIHAQKQQQQYTTPVPILKQINKHNEDGSYSYGYEAADGSYKIESKYPNGEVYGKYGYVDDQGQLREIEYGASRRGFEPAGNEINAAPPTLVNNPEAIRPLQPNEEDDGQYREDPSVYYKDEAGSTNKQTAYQPTYQSRYTQPQTQTQTNLQPFTFQASAAVKPVAQTYQPQYKPPVQQQQTYQPVQQQTYQPVQQQTYQQPQSFQSFQPQQQTYQPQQQTYQPAQQTYQPQPQPQQYQQPAFRPQTTFASFNTAPAYQPAQFNGHPATNFDINSGSYTVQYK